MSAAELLFLTTGGTIDKIYFDANSEFQIGDSLISQLMAESHSEIDFSVQSLMRKDSLDMDDADRQQVAEAVREAKSEKIIITHGTDTMVETAKAIGDTGNKVVVFTGALQPARLRVSDAPFNIGFAVASVQLLPPGAYVAMSSRIFDPHNCRKNYGEQRFEAL